MVLGYDWEREHTPRRVLLKALVGAKTSASVDILLWYLVEILLVPR